MSNKYTRMSAIKELRKRGFTNKQLIDMGITVKLNNNRNKIKNITRENLLYMLETGEIDKRIYEG